MMVSFAAKDVRAAVPHVVEYRGRISVDGAEYDGPAAFKFALVDGVTGATLWNNDGLAPATPEPAATVALQVQGGKYAVLLGDSTLPNMTALPPGIFENGEVRVRVWCSTPTVPLQRLEPDQRIAAVAYALLAETVPTGAITTEKLADGAVRGSKLGPLDAAQITSGTIAAERLAGVTLATRNLGDLTDPAAARANLQVTEPRVGLARTTINVLNQHWPLVVAITGDSVIDLKRYALDRALHASLGSAGYGLGALAFRTYEPATPVVNGFDIWPNGIYAQLREGGMVDYAFDTVTPVMGDTLKLYFVREPDAGSFKVQVATDGGDFIDEPEYTAVDAAGAVAGAVITIRKSAPALRKLRVIGLSGAVKLIGGSIYRDHFPGAMLCNIAQGGINLDTMVLAPSAITGPIMADVAPDLFFFEMKDDANTMSTYLDAYRGIVGLSADWVMIGSSPYGDESANVGQRKTNLWLRSYAASKGLTYWDGYSLFLDGPTAQANGLLAPDGVHLTANGQEFAVSAMFSQLGLSTLGMAGGGGVNSLQGYAVSASAPADGDALRWNAALNQWAPASATEIGHTLWVDATNGSDTAGRRGRNDQPFRSLAAARAAAQSGDVVMVYPGAYQDRDLLRDGVNWLFLPGAMVTSGSGRAMWDDSATGANGPVVCRIEGAGAFSQTSTESEAAVFKITNPGSRVTVRAASLSSAGSAIICTGGSGEFTLEEITTSGPALPSVRAEGGTLEIREARIAAETTVPLVHDLLGATVRLRRCTLVNTGTSRTSGCLLLSSRVPGVLEHCTLVSGPATGSSVQRAGAIARVKTYYSMANRPLQGGVGDLVGPLRVDRQVTE